MKRNCGEPGPAGAVLLEVIVALAILGTVGSSAAWLTQEWLASVYRTEAQEAEVRRADRLMTAVSLWPREDLDRHVGMTDQGPWKLYVERNAATLYEVSIADSTSGAVLLRTALYRELPQRR